MKQDNQEDLQEKIILWLNESVRELHQFGARGTGHEKPCFTLEAFERTYRREEGTRALHVFWHDGLMKVVVIIRDIERPSGIEVVVRHRNGGLIDSVPLKLSGTNPREMWADLRFLPYGPALVLEFEKAV